MHEVELVEVDDEPARSRAAPAPGAPGLRRTGPRVDVELDEEGLDEQPDDAFVAAARTWLRTHARWLVPAAVVLVGTLVVTQLTLDHREAARLAALAAIPGVVPPTDPSIGVIWRADPRVAAVLRSGSVVQGTLVGGLQDESGTPSIVGLDPDTGVVSWSTPVTLPSADPTAPDGSSELWITCSAVPHGRSPVAACIAQQIGQDVLDTNVTSVWVLDPTDGELLSTRTFDGDKGLTFTDGAIVVAERAAPEGADASVARWTVTSSDIVDDGTRWTWTSPPTDVTERAGGAALESTPDHLVVGVDGRAWVLTTDGDPVLDVPLDGDSWLQPARAAVFIESSWTSSELYESTLLLLDGSQLPVDETVGWLAIDDGSAPDVVFTVGESSDGADGLHGRSARTGELLWQMAGTVVTSLLLDGTVYVATVDSLVALDATTGEERWRTELEYMPQQLSTDGQYLLVPGLGVTLEAYALGDGNLEWSTDLSEEVAGDRSTVFVQGFQAGWHDPRLYVWMDSGSVAVLG